MGEVKPTRALGASAPNLMWIGKDQKEGAKFWLSVLSELKQRGLDDVFIFCVDGLKGFPDAIEQVYPHA